ncbi:MAG: nitroreductase family protein [Lachnospiraceae bacterium]|nr:nitroreductase family protein [Lachnospiraceae bacterium]
MNTLQTIFSRKSVRSFNGHLSEEELSNILRVAYASPVGRAMYENVHLTVITKEELLNKISANAAEFFKNPAMNPLYYAPMYILVSAKLAGAADNVGYSNCATIVENMALAAVELGLGACHIWGATIALSQNAELVKELNLPEGFTPCCGLILGKTDAVYEEREILENRIQTAYIK